MNYEALKESINEVLAQTRLKHVTNSHVTFRVEYYAIKENGECVQSASSSIFEDMKWGMLYVHYCPGTNYRGYYDGVTDKHFVSNDGLISNNLVFDDLKIKTNRIESKDGIVLYSAKSSQPEEIMLELDKFLPLLHGCRTKEEADMLIEIKGKNVEDEKDGRRDMVEVLMKEISRLKEALSDYEKKFEEIRSILLRNES